MHEKLVQEELVHEELVHEELVQEELVQEELVHEELAHEELVHEELVQERESVAGHTGANVSVAVVQEFVAVVLAFCAHFVLHDKEAKLLRFEQENVQNAFSAEAPLRTPLGELTALVK